VKGATLVQLLLGFMLVGFMLGLGTRRPGPWLLGLMAGLTAVATVVMLQAGRYM
jgi:hypothetical protein